MATLRVRSWETVHLQPLGICQRGNFPDPTSDLLSPHSEEASRGMVTGTLCDPVTYLIR